jgi:hypothetical protein
MAKVTHVFVTVPEGRIVPVPSNEATAAGGTLLRCGHGKVYCLPWSTFTRRRIPSGDLVLSNSAGSKVTSIEAARAPANTRLEPDGSVSTDQRTDAEINKAATTTTDKGKA